MMMAPQERHMLYNSSTTRWLAAPLLPISWPKVSQSIQPHNYQLEGICHALYGTDVMATIGHRNRNFEAQVLNWREREASEEQRQYQDVFDQSGREGCRWWVWSACLQEPGSPRSTAERSTSSNSQYVAAIPIFLLSELPMRRSLFRVSFAHCQIEGTPVSLNLVHGPL